MGEPGRYREEREGLSARCFRFRLPSFSVPPLRRWLRSLGRRKARSAAFKSFIQEGPGLSPNNAGVLAHLRLGDQRWAQKASVAARAPPPPAG